MNNTTLIYLAVTLATLVFCGVLLLYTPDAGTHSSALIMAGLAVGHWFGYSNQLTSSSNTTQPASETTATILPTSVKTGENA